MDVPTAQIELAHLLLAAGLLLAPIVALIEAAVADRQARTARRPWRHRRRWHG